MQIETQHVQQLEQHHGTGVIVLSVGMEDFAFRRPTEREVTYALTAQQNKSATYLEDLALGCLLTPAAPAAGTPAREGADGKEIPRNAGVSGEDLRMLIEEKGRLEALWEGGQFYRDSIAGHFAFACGWAMEVHKEPLGGERYEVSAKSSANARATGANVAFSIAASKPSRPIYDKYKELELNGDEGTSERYLWDKLVQHPEKAELARLYPFAIIAIGRLLPTLGCDQGTVRVKKFSAGQAPAPGNSTELPASAG